MLAAGCLACCESHRSWTWGASRHERQRRIPPPCLATDADGQSQAPSALARVRRRRGTVLPLAVGTAAALVGSCARACRAAQGLPGSRAKTLVVFRHGEGHHQTDKRIADSELGPQLTERGVHQAKGVQNEPFFAAALAASRRPAFVASNLIRAVETLYHAAPRRPIAVQPLAREICLGSAASSPNCPSRFSALEAWCQARGVTADLSLYYSALGRQATYDQYLASLEREDRHLLQRRLAGARGGDDRLQQLLSWLHGADADTIFLASHGNFMGVLDAEADKDLGASALSALRGEKKTRNCQVRAYRLAGEAPEPSTTSEPLALARIGSLSELGPAA